jgi:mitochondrial fission protein ELM1
MRNYAEFIVSCGSGLSAVNVFMAKENNAKNIVIMKPGPKAYLKKFNLAIIPRHDRPPAGKNVLVTAAAPNLMDEETLKAAGGRLRQSAGIKKDRIVGLLLGGDSAEFSFGEELAAALADRVSRFCAASDSEFLATTSRRTSSEVSSVLKKRFGADPRCRLLVIANESNPEGTVGGILGLSDIVVVSGESISMISEAVSSGKPVIVFSLVKSRPGPAKHEAALKELEKEGYITVSRVEDLDSALHAALKAPGRTRRLEDSHNIFEAVRRLI